MRQLDIKRWIAGLRAKSFSDGVRVMLMFSLGVLLGGGDLAPQGFRGQQVGQVLWFHGFPQWYAAQNEKQALARDEPSVAIPRLKSEIMTAYTWQP